MKRIHFFTIVFIVALLVPVVAQGTKTLSVYKNGFVIARVPVNEIDSMNFNDDGFTLTYDDYIEAPNSITDLLVKYDFYSDAHDVFGLMAILHASDMMSEDIVMANDHWFGYDYKHDNRNFNYRRTKSSLTPNPQYRQIRW